MVDALTPARRKFFTHLLPKELRQTYSLSLPTSYLYALHPDVCNLNSIYEACVDLAVDWLAANIKNRHITFQSGAWLNDMADQIHYMQDLKLGEKPEEKIARRIYSALQDVYGMDTIQFNDSNPPSVFSMLYYLTPPEAGLYKPGNGYTDWAQETAMVIYSHIIADLYPPRPNVLPD